MGQKIRLTESELRAVIREAIEGMLDDVPGGPSKIPAQGQAPAPEPEQTAAMPPIHQNYAEGLKMLIDDIDRIETSLGRFTRLPGEFYGIPNEKMRFFSEAVKNLNAAKTNIQQVL